MQRQAQALRPAFNDDLRALEAAPRYTIHATLNSEQRILEGELTVVYTNRSPSAIDELVFRLFPNATTIYGGGRLEVGEVSVAGRGVEPGLSDAATALHVPIDTPLQPGSTVSAELAFRASVPAETQQGYGIFNQAGGVTTLAGWYPILAPYADGWQVTPVPAVGDALWAETSLYEVALTVPTDVTVVSTGTIIEQIEGNGATTFRIVSGPAREFAAAMSSRFERHTRQVGDTTLAVYALPTADAATSPSTTAEIAAAAFKVYVDRFGPYPYAEFDVVEAVIPIGGYEFTGMVYVDFGLRVRGSGSSYRYIVAHEVAHQWWYNLVGNDVVDEPWLDESLVSYAATVYLEQAVGQPEARGLIAAWVDQYGYPTEGDPPVNSSASRFAGWPTYRAATYYHGALFLDNLRQEMGDEAFFDLLRRYLQRYRYAIATTRDFLSLAQEGSGTSSAGADLTSLFARWFDLP